MCCKSGAQFDYWYRAREAGMKYRYVCSVKQGLIKYRTPLPPLFFSLSHSLTSPDSFSFPPLFLSFLSPLLLYSTPFRWYCHFDDDLYVNPQALVDLLSQYDPTTDQYLGNWAAVARRHKLDRLPVSSNFNCMFNDRISPQNFSRWISLLPRVILNWPKTSLPILKGWVGSEWLYTN